MFCFYDIFKKKLDEKKEEAKASKDTLKSSDWAYLGGEIHMLEYACKIIKEETYNQYQKMDETNS